MEKAEKKEYTREEVAKHNTEGDCWTIVHNEVYKIDGFVKKHPGGLKLIQKAFGVDCTGDFEATFHSKRARNLLETMKIGSVVEKERIHTQGSNLAFGGRGGPINPMMNQNRLLTVPIHKPPSSSTDSPFRMPTIPRPTIKIDLNPNPPSGIYSLILEDWTQLNYNTKILSFIVKNDKSTKFLPHTDETLTCYHIRFYLKLEDEIITRSYTPIDLDFLEIPTHQTRDKSSTGKYHLDFVIKTYTQGKMSKFVHTLSKQDSKISVLAEISEKPIKNVSNNNGLQKPEDISLFHHTGYQYILNKWKGIILISGGTGMSPMLQILKFKSMTKDDTNILWIDVNSKREDLIFEKQIRNIQSKHSNWLSVAFVLTNSEQTVDPNQNEFNAKLTVTLFKDVLSRWLSARFGQDQQPHFSLLQILCCGPPGFNQTVLSIAQQIHFPKDNIIVFE